MDKKALIWAMKNSISEVLETMFFLPVDVSDTDLTKIPCHLENDQISVTKLNFSGPFSGSFVLFIPDEFAVSLTADFLGKDVENVSQENVIETSKEIINMIAGNTFAILDDQAVFDLNIPENILADHDVDSSESGEKIFVKIETMDKYMNLKMVISR